MTRAWLALLVIASSLLAAPAHAAFSGENGLIAFHSTFDGGDLDVWVVEPDGSNLRNLTADSRAEEQQPAWSPDGTRLVFTSNRDGDHEIMMLDLTTGVTTALTQNELLDADATWSPSGEELAFVSDRSGNIDVWKMRAAAGATATQLTNDPAHDADPAWRPKAPELVAFASNRSETFGVYTIDPNGPLEPKQTPTPVVQDSIWSTFPNWSPDGATLGYQKQISFGNFDLYSTPAAGGEQTPLVAAAEDDQGMSFSPDGKQITWGRTNGELVGLYTFPLGGESARRITNNGMDAGGADWQAAPAPPDTTVATASIGDAAAGEGDTAAFTVSLSSASDGPVSVDFATAAGTAQPGSDFESREGTVTIPPGATEATIQVSTVEDSKPEPDESFTVQLSNAQGASLGDATGIGTIADDDPVSISDTTASEGDTAAFTVSLPSASDGPVSVDFATAAGTAQPGSDFESREGTVTIPPGATEATIQVSTVEDSKPEPDESFTVQLSNAQGASLGDHTGTATVVDDDAASIELSPPSAERRTGETQEFTAVVRDTSGRALGGKSVRHDVSGVNPSGGEGATDATGTRAFTLSGVNAGEDRVSVFADTNVNGAQDPEEPSDVATVRWTRSSNLPPDLPADTRQQQPLSPLSLALDPAQAERDGGATHTVRAVVTRDGHPQGGQLVRWTISGPNATSGSGETTGDGSTSVSWLGQTSGIDTATVFVDENRDGERQEAERQGSASVTWRNGLPPSIETAASIEQLSDPTPFREGNVAPVGAGDVFVQLPPGTARVSQSAKKGFIPLREAAQLPVGTVIDSDRGRTRVEAAANSRGSRTSTADFYLGTFRFTQPRARRAVTEMVMRGGSFRRTCRLGRSRSAQAARHRGRRVRRLWADGRGRFRTKGRYSAATVRGTRWLVEDRCSGTLTRVSRGRVTVRDFRARRNVVVRADRSYFASRFARRR